MSTNINNSSQLQSILEKIAQEVIEEVLNEVLELLKKQILKDTYKTNSWYLDGTGQPSYEFLNAWENSGAKKLAGQIVGEVFYNSSKVSYDGDSWKHGNPGRSATEELADILNLAFNGYKAGYTSDLMFGGKHFSHKREPYFANLIEELFDKGKLTKMIDKALKKRLGSGARITISGSYSGGR